jgi:speckle-type POZ protein
VKVQLGKSDVLIFLLLLQAMLHFIYRDTLTEEADAVLSTTSSEFPVSETLIAKLLAAADKYGLERLRLMCESRLCKDINVNSVANILTLADHCHAIKLKAVCLNFAAQNLAGIPT